MQKSKTYWTQLWIILTASLILIVLLEKPIRDYIPVFFGIFGFGRFGFLTWKKHYNLSFTLITKHKNLLTERGIEFGERAGFKRVDFFNLMSERKKLSLSDKEIGNELTELNSLKNITMISFLGIVIFSGFYNTNSNFLSLIQ